ncbi:response regulator [Polaromonas sp. P1(28)-13]|nr:response regulator [Polaromonas sp. P1(28)-13]
MSTQSSPSPAKILIAEDSPTQAKRLQHILQQQGYEVVVAGNGRIALDMAARSKPALIISDVVMPEMDGYELSNRVKADANLRDIPVILVTTMSDPQDVIRGLECGADNFVLKPYDERYLLGRVRYVLANREFHQPQEAGMGVELYFNDKKHYITAGRLQILNLLLSTYDAAIQRNKQLQNSQQELQVLNSKLAAVNRELESFSYSVSHDLARRCGTSMAMSNCWWQTAPARFPPKPGGISMSSPTPAGRWAI